MVTVPATTTAATVAFPLALTVGAGIVATPATTANWTVTAIVGAGIVTVRPLRLG